MTHREAQALLNSHHPGIPCNPCLGSGLRGWSKKTPSLKSSVYQLEPKSGLTPGLQNGIDGAARQSCALSGLPLPRHHTPSGAGPGTGVPEMPTPTGLRQPATATPHPLPLPHPLVVKARSLPITCPGVTGCVFPHFPEAPKDLSGHNLQIPEAEALPHRGYCVPSPLP